MNLVKKGHTLHNRDEFLVSTRSRITASLYVDMSSIFESNSFIEQHPF